MKRKMRIVLTVLNILLFIGSVVCTVQTFRNNKIINSIAESFAYREEGKKVFLTLRNGKEVSLEFGRDSVKIIRAYEQAGTEGICQTVIFIRNYAREKGYEIERDVTEMCGEIRLHGILYELGYKREQTGDCDLDYITDRRWYVNMMSKVIGWIGI